MKSLDESIIESLDGGGNKALLPYLPYLLQDLWEIGSDPMTMLGLIKRYIKKDRLQILDLGCGKGAVSIQIARELEVEIMGIDAIPEFIQSAQAYAVAHEVAHKCHFILGDIRIKIEECKGFDVVILGAIGPVLGNVSESLSLVKQALTGQGYVLLDDGYLPDTSRTDYHKCLRKTAFFHQIQEAGFRIIHEELFSREKLSESDMYIFSSIERRAHELIERHPENKGIFEGYLKDQSFENQMLENEIITGTWLLQAW